MGKTPDFRRIDLATLRLTIIRGGCHFHPRHAEKRHPA
jgi:hypothetical protein